MLPWHLIASHRQCYIRYQNYSSARWRVNGHNAFIKIFGSLTFGLLHKILLCICRCLTKLKIVTLSRCLVSRKVCMDMRLLLLLLINTHSCSNEIINMTKCSAYGQVKSAQGNKQSHVYESANQL